MSLVLSLYERKTKQKRSPSVFVLSSLVLHTGCRRRGASITRHNRCECSNEVVNCLPLLAVHLCFHPANNSWHFINYRYDICTYKNEPCGTLGECGLNLFPTERASERQRLRARESGEREKREDRLSFCKSNFRTHSTSLLK